MFYALCADGGKNIKQLFFWGGIFSVASEKVFFFNHHAVCNKKDERKNCNKTLSSRKSKKAKRKKDQEINLWQIICFIPIAFLSLCENNPNNSTTIFPSPADPLRCSSSSCLQVPERDPCPAAGRCQRERLVRVPAAAAQTLRRLHQEPAGGQQGNVLHLQNNGASTMQLLFQGCSDKIPLKKDQCKSPLAPPSSHSLS